MIWIGVSFSCPRMVRAATTAIGGGSDETISAVASQWAVHSCAFCASRSHTPLIIIIINNVEHFDKKTQYTQARTDQPLAHETLPRSSRVAR